MPDFADIEGFNGVLCYNDKKKTVGDRVNLSVRPEKFGISIDPPKRQFAHMNALRAKVEDIIYTGNHTNYWVSVGRRRVAVYQQHAGYLLDEKPIRWGDEVWLYWNADSGYMLDDDAAPDESLLPPKAPSAPFQTSRTDAAEGALP